MKRWSGLLGDRQSAAEMTASPSAMSVVTTMNGPKVSDFVALVKFGYMLENPRISEYSPIKWQ